MEEVFGLEAISNVTPGMRVTVLGRVENRTGEFLVLNDTTGSIKVRNVPLDSTGMIEVRGVCQMPGILEANSFTPAHGDIDIEDHLKLVEMYKKAPVLG